MCMTFYEWSCVYSGYVKNQAREWARARYIGWWLYAVNSTENPKKSPSDLMPLPTDPVKPKLKAPTPEEKDEIRRKAEERIRQFANQIKK